ncbi:MAG: hypothetical protein H6746_19170 [Deltaproteobacteria bacterium]|nr:hypothetical protein [Deltaproteobacteria bacterium]
MPRPTRIDEVIERLGSIIGECRAARSRLGYFPALYKRVTVAVRDGIAGGRFDDGPRMERLDVVFANRYLDAFDAWAAGRPVTRSWALAFEAARSPQRVVLQHLLLGMNAHINLDLGIAAAEVAPGPALAGLRGDFLRINTVLAELTGEVKGQLTAIWPLIGLLERAAGTADDVVAEFSMSRARDDAWDFAQVLAPRGPEARALLIGVRDHWAAAFGRITLEPPGLGEVLAQLLAMDEAASVPDVIDILDRA